jgi:hypothetical protein
VRPAIPWRGCGASANSHPVYHVHDAGMGTLHACNDAKNMHPAFQERHEVLLMWGMGFTRALWHRCSRTVIGKSIEEAE